MNPLILHTKRLRLVAGTSALARAAIKNKNEFSSLLQATLPVEWPHKLLKDVEPYFATCLEQNPSSTGWWIWYVILKNKGSDKLIGNTCFKGPQTDGMVELGMTFLDEFQNQGYGTEAGLAMIHWAFNDRMISQIIGQTLSHLNVPIKIMEKLGMIYIGDGIEEGERDVVRYGLTREAWSYYVSNNQ